MEASNETRILELQEQQRQIEELLLKPQSTSAFGVTRSYNSQALQLRLQEIRDELAALQNAGTFGFTGVDFS